MVLFRAPTVIQSDCRSEVSLLSGAKNLVPSTINVRLAAVRRLAYEAADTGLLSPELAAGIRRVKGAKRLNVRIGNWLTLEQAKGLLPIQRYRNDSCEARWGHPRAAHRLRPSESRTRRS